MQEEFEKRNQKLSKFEAMQEEFEKRNQKLSKFAPRVCTYKYRGMHNLLLIWNQLTGLGTFQAGNVLTLSNRAGPYLDQAIEFDAREYVHPEGSNISFLLTNDERRRVLVELCEILHISRDCCVSTKKKEKG
jgi:hypothetical protein